MKKIPENYFSAMKEDVQFIWEQCAKNLKMSLHPTVFNTWIRPLIPLRFERNAFTLEVPSHFFYEYIEAHIAPDLLRALKAATGPDVQLFYKVIMLKDQAVSTNETSRKHHYLRNRPQTCSRIVNEYYRLESFVKGNCNSLALKVACDIASNPYAARFRTVLFTGDTGTGKSHLVQGIANALTASFADLYVHYTYISKFVLDYQEAVAQKSIEEFVRTMKYCDVLIVEDLQDAQEEDEACLLLAHIVSELQRNNKIVLFTSTQEPENLFYLPLQLTAAVRQASHCRILPPDYSTRLAVINEKLKNENIEFPQDVTDYIASLDIDNIRILEGLIISIIAQSTLARTDIDIDLIKRLMAKPPRRHVRNVDIDLSPQADNTDLINLISLN